MVEAQQEKPLVTITGITGFLGVATALAFIEEGGFRIRGTVRSKTNAAKIDPLKAALGAAFDDVELVEADLLDKESMKAAVAGSTYVAHTASPFVMTVSKDNKDELIKPAVDGTLSVLEGAKEAGVKKVVVTSSMAAIQAVAAENKPADGVWNSSHWSDPDRPEGMNPYLESKTLAERAAWKYVEDLPEGEKFDLITICPCFILGPTKNQDGFTSGGFIKGALLGKTKPIAKSAMGIVDVRDVALAHVRAITVPEAAGQRFITWAGSFWRIDIQKILDEEFTSKGWPIVTEEGPETGDVQSKVDNSPSKDILGIEYHSLKDTILGMANAMIESGHVQKPE